MGIKPKYRGWKEGILTQTIWSVGGTTLRKGQVVRYKRHKSFDEDGSWNGEYEWHYVDQNNYNLIRESKLYINENKK